MSNRVSPEPGSELVTSDGANVGERELQEQERLFQVSPQPQTELVQADDSSQQQQEEEDEVIRLAPETSQTDNDQENQRREEETDIEQRDTKYYSTENIGGKYELEEEEDEAYSKEAEKTKRQSAGEYLGVVRPGDTATQDGQHDVSVIHAERAPAEVGQPQQRRLPPINESPRPTNTEDNFTRREKMSSNARPASGKAQSDIIGGANNSPQDNGCCAVILTILSYMLVILFFPFSLCATIKVVQEYERAVIFRLGRLLPGGAKGPGIFFVMPCIEEYSKVDLRTVSFDVPPQEVLTRDSVTVSVDAVVYYRISSPTVSVANVENAANSTQLLAQTTLRNVLGTQNLSEILSNREHISEQMQNVLDDATDKWGIKVERVEIKDVRLPTQLQRAMAAEAEAARDARAKVIAAEGEQKASYALKEAADIISVSPAALQLRYLQTLNSISAEKNSTIIFPLPIELVSGLIKK